jgi:hypothetical protein
MSANRSIQAAQRRRAGPTNAEPAIPGGGPQPSIKSAQMFANQAKPGSGPNIPTGRLAGQQAAAAQKQQMQQQQQTKAEGLSSVSKMTVPQAITLITLRLGAVETKLINMQETGGLGNHYDVDGNEQSEDLTGMASVCFQHELDHLEGITFKSRAGKFALELAMKKQANLLKELS